MAEVRYPVAFSTYSRFVWLTALLVWLAEILAGVMMVGLQGLRYAGGGSALRGLPVMALMTGTLGFPLLIWSWLLGYGPFRWTLRRAGGPEIASLAVVSVAAVPLVILGAGQPWLGSPGSELTLYAAVALASSVLVAPVMARRCFGRVSA